ncbi:hypothetical protein DFQ27_002345 [Actinomortierella ambigua]|uniref:Glycine cleavage system H protein n=1 Tax=Actinomortierella ambigua TaxID=1343610 RepID=A0A9P6U755_9FUNG|nr:hypothetical protein DFQ26_004379 [Actinomortierella ambigua]KAG0262419.1 hypothetical protein DFQ27_002345 [Actinomortierella ambigua]
MSLRTLSARLFPAVRAQAMARAAAPASFARFYGTKRYTKEHEWIEVDNGVGTVGITDYAQNSLGEIVFVEPAELKTVETHDNIGSVESVKAASDIFAPIAGEVIEVNAALADEPGLLNEHPESQGWLCKIKVADQAEVDALLDEAAYKAFCEESH